MQESQKAIDEAHVTLAVHVADDDGWCVACGERAPCMYVKDARSVLVRAGVLRLDNTWPGDER